MTIAENATRLLNDHTALIEAMKAAEGLHPELHIDGEANPSQDQVSQALKYISLCEEDTENPVGSYTVKHSAENLEPQQYVSEDAMIVAAIMSGVRVNQEPNHTTLAIRKSIQCCSDFWKWVADYEITDDPQGDFVQDTRELIRGSLEPCERVHRLDDNPGGLRAYHTLRATWNQETGFTPPPDHCPSGRTLHEVATGD